MTRVVVTGLGTITPLGVGVKTTWKSLIQSKSGLVSTNHLEPQADWNQIPCKVVGKVPEGLKANDRWDANEHFNKSEQNRLALFTQYALVATEEALSNAKLDLSKDNIDKTTIGVNIGSGIGSFHDIYHQSNTFKESGYKKINPFFIPKFLTNMASGNISIKYKLQGPNHAVSTACATGLNSVGDAYNFIKNGYSKVMISGSTELSIHPLALAGFARAKSVVTNYNEAPELASRPFDANRNGFVLGEGCGILILEELQHALDRGLTDEDIYGEVVGYGLSGDGHHITAPPESGKGAQLAMEMALRQSHLEPATIDYINAHATSTRIGDLAENNAIYNVFKLNPNHLSISATKSSIGHLLGAAGSVESIVTLMALRENVIPPTLNLNDFDAKAADKFVFDYVPNEPQARTIKHALNNSFGFGGVNSSIIFKSLE